MNAHGVVYAQDSCRGLDPLEDTESSLNVTSFSPGLLLQGPRSA